MRRLEEMAAARSVTAPQLALAWLLAKGEDIVPIPGTKKRGYLEQNVAAVSISGPGRSPRLDEAIPSRDDLGSLIQT